MAHLRRPQVTMQPMAFMAPMVAALALAGSAPCRADEGKAAGAGPEAGVVAPVPATASPAVSPGAPSANVPRARVPRTQTHRMAGHGIDETVRRMSRGLGLDAGQQMQLQEILLDQQRQIRKLRGEPPPAGVDWAAVTMGIADQTKARIRGMLTAEQKEKYTTDVAHEMTAPAQADLQHWMRIQESNRLKDDGDSK
jgi:hypothetical protein